MATLNMNDNGYYNSSFDRINYGSIILTWDHLHSRPEVIKEYYAYPLYPNAPVYGDKYKKAFNIAKLLLKKKLLVSRKLEDFIELVEEIAKEL